LFGRVDRRRQREAAMLRLVSLSLIYVLTLATFAVAYGGIPA
jgi:hypothetical protein